MKIIVDAMGGDNAPREIVRGAVMAAREFSLEVVLVGSESVIRELLAGEDVSGLKLEVVDAPEAVTMEDSPASVFREKKNTSMGVALKLLADGAGDALVSAGSTGALLTGSTLFVKRIRGIRRAALAPIVPTGKGGALLIDCGANVECTPEYLMQFAYMADFYVKHQMGVETPRIALLNNGTEESKGTPVYKETYQLLKAASARGDFHFVGNVEGREIIEGGADIILCDGFTGNIFLKTMEGTALFLMRQIKDIFKANLLTKLAAAAVLPGMKKLKKLMDYKETGGAPLLGISRPVIKAHGSSDAYAFRGAMRQAMIYAQSGVVTKITENIEKMTASAQDAAAGEK